MNLNVLYQESRVNGDMWAHESTAAPCVEAHHVQCWGGKCPLDDPDCWLHSADHHQLQWGALEGSLLSLGRPSAQTGRAHVQQGRESQELPKIHHWRYQSGWFQCYHLPSPITVVMISFMCFDIIFCTADIKGFFFRLSLDIVYVHPFYLLSTSFYHISGRWRVNCKRSGSCWQETSTPSIHCLSNM